MTAELERLTTSQAANLLQVPVSDIGLARRSDALDCVADHDCEHSAGNGHQYRRADVEAFGRRTQHPGGIALTRPGVESKRVSP